MENQEYYTDLIKDNMPLFGIRILTFLNNEGGLAYRFSLDASDETSIISTLGTLSLFQSELLAAHHYATQKKRELGGEEGSL